MRAPAITAQRQRRAALQARGVCVDCRDTPIAPDLTSRCRWCQDRSNLRVRAHRQNKEGRR